MPQRWIALILVLLTAAPASAVGSSDSLYVVQHGWHPGVLIPLPTAQPLLLGVLEAGEATFIEVGWGDAGYYPDPDPGIWTLLRAALWPTPSVIQIVAVDRPPGDFASSGPVIAVPLPDSLKPDLLAFVIDELAFLDDAPVDVGPSLYGRGRFFAAERRYHMFHNSNQWAARLLRTAGCDLSVWQSLTVELFLQQASGCGNVIRHPSAESQASLSR